MSSSLSCLTAAISPDDLRRLSPGVLAHLGDAVYELFVRTSCLLPPRRLQAYHAQVVRHVRAETQAQSLKVLLPQLTPNELEILRWGRNASPRGPKRLDPGTYQEATALETLLGYLYLSDAPRLDELLMALREQMQFEEASPPSSANL